MNANQLINMVMRIVMRKTISKGIDAGVKHATRSTRAQAKPIQHHDGDHMMEGQPDPQDGKTQAQIRQQRQARRAARQARQAAKNGNGTNSA